MTIAADFVVDSIKKTLNDIKDHWYGVKFEKAIPGLIKMIEKEKILILIIFK